MEQLSSEWDFDDKIESNSDNEEKEDGDWQNQLPFDDDHKSDSSSDDEGVKDSKSDESKRLGAIQSMLETIVEKVTSNEAAIKQLQEQLLNG